MSNDNQTIPLPSAMQQPAPPKVAPATPLPSAMQQPAIPKTPPIPTNPLAQYFRRAAAIVQLPTKGKFWPDGVLELDMDGNLEVYPMTAKDEIMMKSPDGLLNGSSIVETINSCCPGIKNPLKIPGIDLDTILIAIRMASYGPELEITTVCEHCNEKNENMIDLRVLLDNVPQGVIEDVVQIGELTMTLQPYDYEFMNKITLNSFEEQQLIRSLDEKNMNTQEKSTFINATFKKLVIHTIESITTAVIKITMLDGTEVVNRNDITQFFQNCDRDTFNKTKDKITALSDHTQYPPFTIVCESCGKSYETQLQFNQTNFFE